MKEAPYYLEVTGMDLVQNGRSIVTNWVDKYVVCKSARISVEQSYTQDRQTYRVTYDSWYWTGR